MRSTLLFLITVGCGQHPAESVAATQPAPVEAQTTSFVTPVTFDDIVDLGVVESTVTCYAKQSQLVDQREFLDGYDLSLRGLYRLAWPEALRHLGIESLSSRDPELAAKRAVVEAVPEIIRQHLKDPEHLRMEYRHYKPALVAGVQRSEALPLIREYLDQTVIPYFTQPVPDNVLQAERALLAVEARCFSAASDDELARCWEDRRVARNAFMNLTPDHRVLQWMHRRQAEGGDQLVEAWGEILVDFSASL